MKKKENIVENEKMKKIIKMKKKWIFFEKNEKIKK